MTLLLCQFQLINLKAAEVSAIDDEELPAIDPFAGGLGSTNQVVETGDSVSTNNGFLNNMRLVGTILGKNKKIAVFSSPDGGAYKYEENPKTPKPLLKENIFYYLSFSISSNYYSIKYLKKLITT